MLIKPDRHNQIRYAGKFHYRDHQLFDSIKKDVEAHKDMIIENGYTGVIDDTHKDEIVDKHQYNRQKIALLKGELHPRSKVALYFT